MKAMILAAGLGTRLGALTESIPKPMLSINGRPLIEYNIRNLARAGFTEIIINLHFLPEIIQDFVRDGRAFGARVEYSYEEELLGTAGGVKKVEEFFDDSEPFLVVYGDLLTNQDFSLLGDIHTAHAALATITLHQRLGSNSLVKLEDNNRISGFVERPAAEERQRYPFPWVNSGIQLLQKEVLKNVEKGAFADLPKDVYPELVEKGRLFGMPLSGDRVAIDSPERYNQACKLAQSWEQ